MSATQASSHSQHPLDLLELCIATNRVGLYPPPPEHIISDELAHEAMTTGPPNPTSPSDFTYLLSGPLNDFLLFSRQERSQWLIDIAHDICDPAQKRGSLQVRDAAGNMRNVNPSEPLTASTYLYDVQAVVSLSKISKRRNKSKTDVAGDPSTMADRVKERDGQCWVSGMPASGHTRTMTVNSHICPKRMGDHVLRIIYRNFVSTDPPDDLSIYNGICGITLNRNLDSLFDTYDLGLRLVAPNVYDAHNFPWPEDESITIFGYLPIRHPSTPPLHGHRFSPPQPQHPDNPPPGLIRWHYLQCVIRKFAHLNYKDLQNIDHYELSLRMEGDSDNESTDSEFEWPSAILDRGRAMEMEIEDFEERQKIVAEWATTV